MSAISEVVDDSVVDQKEVDKSAVNSEEKDSNDIVMGVTRSSNSFLI